MLYGLIELSWFDLTTVGFTVVSIVLVQILNAIWVTLDDNKTLTTTPTSDNNGVRKSLKINELKSLISNDSTTNYSNKTITIEAATPISNGKLEKQQSEQNEKYVSKFH